MDIQIIGINELGHELANDWISEGRDIPWLQDVDADGNRASDVWRDEWQITYRDVVIIDDNNVEVGVFNLTTHDLANPDHYDTLRQMLVDAAVEAAQPDFQPGDVNCDYSFDQLDLIQMLRAGKYGTGEPATWDEGDSNGDGVFDQLDILAALQTGNFLQGPYAAVSTSDAASVSDDDTLARDDVFVELYTI